MRNIIFDALEIDAAPNDTINECLDIAALRPRTVADKETDSRLYYYSYAKKDDRPASFALLGQAVNEVIQKLKL